jgi:hypothetical protein
MIKLKFLKKQYLSANEQVERDFITVVARHTRLAVPLAGRGTGAVDRPRRDAALKSEMEAEAGRLKLPGHTTAETVRYNERSTVGRVNPRLEDEFGGRFVRVRGNAKVMCHLMFGILALTADQSMRFVT